MTQVGNTRLQLSDGFINLVLDIGLVDFSIRTLQKPELLLFERDIRLQAIEALRNFSLFFELFEVGGEFTQNILNARQVLAGIAEAVFSFTAALFVFRNACGLL